MLAEKTHDSSNYLALQFCSRSYPGNSPSLQPRHCFIVYNCFLSLGSTYLSNNSLLAEKTHDSINSLAQQFCSRSYPGNSSSLLPRHCFIVYNCFLFLGSTYLCSNSLLAEKTHDSSNSLAQQFCSRSYPGNSSSFPPRHCFSVYNCFRTLGSTYLSNNSLLAEKTHDSTNSLAQQLCSRSYPGNSSSLLPRHCFIVYNCFLSLGSTYLCNNSLLAEKTHDSSNSLAQQFCSRSYPGNSSSFPPRHCFSVYNCFRTLGSTYLSNNSLLAEKTHDSTNTLAQQFCSRSYPGNSSSLLPRHCFIVYNCFLSLGSYLLI